MPAEVCHGVGPSGAPRAPASWAGQGPAAPGMALCPRPGCVGWGGRHGPPPHHSAPPSEGTVGLGTSAHFRPIRITQGSSHGASQQVPSGQPVDANAWKSFCRQLKAGARAAQKMPQFLGSPCAGQATLEVQGGLPRHEPCLQQSCQPQGRLGDSWEQDVSQPAKFNPPTLARLKIGSLQHR